MIGVCKWLRMLIRKQSLYHRYWNRSSSRITGSNPIPTPHSSFWGTIYQSYGRRSRERCSSSSKGTRPLPVFLASLLIVSFHSHRSKFEQQNGWSHILWGARKKDSKATARLWAWSKKEGDNTVHDTGEKSGLGRDAELAVAVRWGFTWGRWGPCPWICAGSHEGRHRWPKRTNKRTQMWLGLHTCIFQRTFVAGSILKVAKVLRCVFKEPHIGN